MAQQKILKNLNKGAVAGLVITALSFFVRIVPCTRSPVIAEPKYSFAFCKLPNPFGEQLLGVSTKYYGLFTDSLAGTILQFIIPAIIIALILIIFKKKPKILDLSKRQ